MGWVLLLILLSLPGYMVWVWVTPDVQAKTNSGERLLLIVVGSMALVSLPAMALTELGWFSFARLFASVVLITGLLLLGRQRNNRFFRPQWPNPLQNLRLSVPSILALALLLLSFWLGRTPFEYIVGGRDHGVYVNTGIQIARTGSLFVADATLTELPLDSRRALIWAPVISKAEDRAAYWDEGQRLSGLIVRDLDDLEIVPHAFHLYPVWIAIFYAAGGISGALLTTLFMSLLGTTAIYLVARRLAGEWIALLALFLVVLNINQIWFQQYPTAEIMFRLFFWAGLLALGIAWQHQDRITAVLAGLSLGLIHLAKLDAIFIPPLLLGALLFVWLRRQWQPHHTGLLISYLLTAAYALFHGFFFATQYLLNHTIPILLPGFVARPLAQATDGLTEPGPVLRGLITAFPIPIILLIGGGLLIGILLWRYGRSRSAIWEAGVRYEPQFKSGLFLLLSLLLLYVYFFFTEQPIAEFATTNWSLDIISWYISPLGLLLGFIGLWQFGLAIPDRPAGERTSVTVIWYLILANSIPLLILGAGTASDHFWASRRYLPVLIPTLLIFAAVQIQQVNQAHPASWQNWPRYLLPVGLTAVLALSFWQDTRPLLGLVEYEGLVDNIAALAAATPDNAVLLFDEKDASGRVTLPLWFIHDKTVFMPEPAAYQSEGLRAALQIWQAQDRPLYWIDTQGQPPPHWPDLTATYVTSHLIVVPLAEQPASRIPRQVGAYMATYDLYRLDQQPAETKKVATALIAPGQQDGQLGLSGLYAPEGVQSPRRWTGPVVQLSLPLTKRPSQLLLLAQNGRPPDLPPPEVTIFINDQPIGTVTVSGAIALYKLPIPADFPLGETAVIRLEIPPWIPAQTGHSTDERPLGIYLDWIKIVSEE